MRQWIKILTVACLSVACSPTLQRSELEIPESYSFGSGFNISDQELSERWWESFNDPTLNYLEELAIANNKDLGAALTSVISAREYIGVARAEFLPSLSFDATVEDIHELESTTREYTIEPTIDWELSLFGELRNTKRAAQAALFSKEWNFRGAILSLTSEVATTYFTLLEYRRSLDIATRSYKLREEATALIDSMYRYGMSDGIALMQAKSLVYSARIEMQKYQRATHLSELSLNTLLGNSGLEFTLENSQSLATDDLPINIPVGLPSSLLERRPDIMECYYAMSQAGYEVGIRRAERYPSLSLTASGGVFAESLKDLTSGNPAAWSFTASLVEPIFNFGKLRRRERMARESYYSTLLDYEQSIIEAIADVESALVKISTNKDQSSALAALVIANSGIVDSTSALYRSGMGNYLSVIDAERELYSSQIELIASVAEQYINYIDLYVALGGGW